MAKSMFGPGVNTSAKVTATNYTGTVGVTGKVIGKVEKAPVSTWAAAKRDRVEGSFGRAVNAVADASHASSDANIRGTADAHLRAAKANDRAAEIIKSRGGDHARYTREADGHREKAVGAKAAGAKSAAAWSATGKASETTAKGHEKAEAAHRDAAQAHRAVGNEEAAAKHDTFATAHATQGAGTTRASNFTDTVRNAGGDPGDIPRDERGRFASK